MTKAETILEQLGGKMFAVMTGAKSYSSKFPDPLLEEAADEIERLRRIVDRASSAWLRCDGVAWDGDLADAVEAAVAEIERLRGSTVEQRFCKPPIAGSTPAAGFSASDHFAVAKATGIEAEWRGAVEGMKFFDQPVQDMDAERLLLVIGYLVIDNKRLAQMSYDSMADAMLRERLRNGAVSGCETVQPKTNLDASPEAKADLPDERPPNAVSANGGTPCAASRDGSGTGKQPALPCVETDGFSSDSRTGQINRTPECESPRRECGESAIRDVARPDTKGKAAGGPDHHISEAEIDALQHVVEDGRFVDLADYGRLCLLLVRLRPEGGL